MTRPVERLRERTSPEDMRTLAATFTWLTLLMLAFALLPYIGALFHGRRTP